MGDALDYWLENRAKQKRSEKDDESIIRQHLRPAFGALRLREIHTAIIPAVDRYFLEREHFDKKTVNNQLTLLISVLNVALDLGWRHRVAKLKKLRVRLFNRD